MKKKTEKPIRPKTEWCKVCDAGPMSVSGFKTHALSDKHKALFKRAKSNHRDKFSSPLPAPVLGDLSDASLQSAITAGAVADLLGDKKPRSIQVATMQAEIVRMELDLKNLKRALADVLIEWADELVPE